MKAYDTIPAPAQAEVIEKRSRFLAYAYPVSTMEEITEHQAKLRKLHYDARHQVFAYRLRSGAERCSDDGEPQGSSGLPTLNVLQRRDLCDVLVIVVRYFGGVLLGTGGLSRAYSAAAGLALDAAGVLHMAPLTQCELKCSYSQYQRLLFCLQAEQCRCEPPVFGEQVVLRFFVEPQRLDSLQAILMEQTAGAVRLNQLGEQCLAE